MEASQDAWKKELQKQDVYFYEIQTILTITDNFSAENKLGQGGFGPVYKVSDLNMLLSFSCFPLLNR